MSPFPSKYLTVGGDDPFLPSLLAAINHADQISITSAFVRLTGLELIVDALIDALDRGADVRILTGDYLGITDPHALRYLMLLKEEKADVRVFESGGLQSFHMKAYVFYTKDDEGIEEGCAFIGSSNLTRSALAHGLEWNLRVDYAENEARFFNICEEFDRLFNDPRCKELMARFISERPDIWYEDIAGRENV